MAHPTRYKFSRTKLVKLIEEMKLYGVNALEVSTPITEAKQIKMLADLCVQYDLAASLGSDFHSPTAAMGAFRWSTRIGPEAYAYLDALLNCDINDRLSNTKTFLSSSASTTAKKPTIHILCSNLIYSQRRLPQLFFLKIIRSQIFLYLLLI